MYALHREIPSGPKINTAVQYSPDDHDSEKHLNTLTVIDMQTIINISIYLDMFASSELEIAAPTAAPAK